MRVAVVTGPGAVELREEPVPELGPDDLLVEIDACGLCTMERRLFSGTKAIYPVAPGHEVAGRVVDAGAAVSGLAGSPGIGDRVIVDLLTRCGTCRTCRRGRSAVCRTPQGDQLSDGTVSMGAGLADFVRVPARQAYQIGAAPPAVASMGEPLACVIHSIRLSGFTAGDRVTVIGGGFMGRLHLALARAAGAETIGVVDVDADRRSEALAAGATWVAAPAETDDHRQENDIVYVTAGGGGIIESALELCDHAATLVIYGAFPKELTATITPDAIHHHELAILGVYSQEPVDWRVAAAMIRAGTLTTDLEALVTARYTLDRVDEALAHASGQPVYRVLVGG